MDRSQGNGSELRAMSKTYRVEEIAQILGIGCSTAYNLVKTGCFKVVRIGASIRISRKFFDEWLDRMDA